MSFQCYTIKKLIILSVGFFIFCGACAATNPFQLLWGKTAPTEIIFAPFGYHTIHGLDDQYIFHPKPGAANDAQYLVAFHWKSLAVATYTNSFRDQVVLVALYRQIIYYKKFNLSYMIGVATGYGDQAGNLDGPATLQSLIQHDPGLTAALDAQLVLTKHLSFHVIAPPNFCVLEFGFGYIFS